MTQEVRSFFDEVQTLLRILLVNPASSCSAKRSFSSLRRLKTWLRSTRPQKRLNSVALCHIHQEILDTIDTGKIAQKCISRSQQRVLKFGWWSDLRFLSYLLLQVLYIDNKLVSNYKTCDYTKKNRAVSGVK